MLASHLRALLKKNLLISKSTIILTLIEILSPILIMLGLLGLKSLFKLENWEFQDDATYVINNSSLLKRDGIKLIVDEVAYRGSLYYCNDRRVIAFVGKNFPKKLANEFIKHSWERVDIEFKYYSDFETLSDYVKSKKYGVNEGKICFAVSYKKENNKYTYKLHYYASSFMDNEPPEIPSTEVGVGDRLNKQPDFKSHRKYTQSGFFMIQKFFYDYVLQEETGNPNAKIDVILCPKKYDKYVHDPFAANLEMLWGFFTVIAYAIPLTINMYRIIKEKETRAKEGMKIMGLSELTYFLSNILTYFFKNIIYSIFITIILSYGLKRIESIYIFFIYLLYGLVVFALIFFLQSFLERTIIAIILSLLIYALMYFFFLLVYQNSINLVVKYLFCILFPPTTLQLGINTISNFETNFQEFNGRVEYKYNKFSVINMYIFLCVNFFFYLFIGFILQNVLPHEYGIRQPINFLFTSSFWGIGKENNNIILEENIINNIKEIQKYEKNVNENKKVDIIINIRNEKYSNGEKKSQTDNTSKVNDNINNGQIKIDESNTSRNPKSSEELIKNDKVLHLSKNTQKTKTLEIGTPEYNFESENFYEMNYTKPNDVLKIRNICKIFDDGKKALNNVSFNLYKNEIFALLGHNGAGKSTLISILSGLYPATSGYAIYNNENVISSQGHSNFRKYLGICPQHDVLFDDLTVNQHLEMFCVFKSVPSEKKSSEIDKILKDFDLIEKKDTKACNLSGGQKRKLSICIALVGGSSVIFLDEPTSGMDITSRRNLWDILKRYAGGRIIILTTHYMEEAAVLGNRIGILSEGDMKCMGSPLFLIERFSKNINLNITKKLNSNNEEIINFVQKNINDNNIEYEIYTEEILFKIPKDNQNFSGKKFFKLLDENCHNLNIKNYSISMSTLEDVFINVSKLTKAKKEIIYDIDGNRLDDEDVLEQKKREKNYLVLYDDNNYNEKYSYCSKILLDTKVSIKKRLIQIYKDKKTLFLEILCPILLAFIGCLVCYLEIIEKNETIKFDIQLITNDRQTIYYYPCFEDNNEIKKIIFDFSKKDNLDIELKQIDVKYDTSSTIILIRFMNKILEIETNEPKSNYGNYIFNKIDKDKQNYEITVLSDIKLRQTSPIYYDFIMKNIIRYATDKPNLEIEVINEPLPYTYLERKDSKERNNSMLLVFISICFTLIPANFVTIIIREKENNSKHLQIISGISLLSYWVNNFIFELFKYYIIGAICLVFLKIFGFYETYVGVLYLLYGPPLVAFTYIIGSIVKKEGTGQALVILINLFIGAIGGTAVFVMRMYKQLIDIAIPFAYAFRIIPSFCFCYGYNILLDRDYIFAVDLEKDLDGVINWGTAYLIVTGSSRKYYYDILSLKYLGCDFIYLGIESIVYILILVFIENKEKIFSRCITSSMKPKDEIYYISKDDLHQNQKKNQKQNENDIQNLDEPNIEHSNIIDNTPNSNIGDSSQISIPNNVDDTYVKNEIIKAKVSKESENYAIKIINLIKNYYGGPFCFKCFKSCFKETKAVRDISLCLNYGECFGFLGVNGAGKTTTFKCLSKEILPTYGKIYIDNKEINEDFDKVRSLIGYCPQFDAIFESLTVYENLEFYGLIKGAKRHKIDQIINALMDEMSLTPFKDIVSGKLSGGNKRKLSVAIAIICNPPIILLDEPSTGMDPEARRYMWGVIHRISLNRKKSTIIMTTHSMEEAETLCERIAIMVDGQFKCLATSDEIKAKYGYGYEINLQINNPNFEGLFEKYKILEEDKEAQINTSNIAIFLQKYQLMRFNNELVKDRLGGKIIEEINACGYVYLKRIIAWIYYLENALKMIQIILVDFPEIHCSDYGENNFVFKIIKNTNNKDKNQNEKSIGYLFGIIEENNHKFNIEQYFLQLTSLEQIFNQFARETEKVENQNIYMRNIDIPINNELISSLFNITRN